MMKSMPMKIRIYWSCVLGALILVACGPAAAGRPPAARDETAGVATADTLDRGGTFRANSPRADEPGSGRVALGTASPAARTVTPAPVREVRREPYPTEFVGFPCDPYKVDGLDALVWENTVLLAGGRLGRVLQSGAQGVRRGGRRRVGAGRGGCFGLDRPAPAVAPASPAGPRGGPDDVFRHPRPRATGSCTPRAATWRTPWRNLDGPAKNCRGFCAKATTRDTPGRSCRTMSWRSWGSRADRRSG